jgi:gas vesicle protein
MSTGPIILVPEDNQPPDEQRHQTQWKAQICGVQPAFAWATTALAGTVAISIFPVTNIVRLVAPVFCMAAYTWVTYPRMLPPGLQAARVAQLADSAYFLGFLWTLWALIDSFVLKHTDPNDAAFRAFGYALFTTAAGMAIRMYLLNFKYRSEEQTGEAEALIEDRLQALAKGMLTAKVSVQDLSRNTDVLNKTVASLSGALSTLESDFAGAHKKTTDAINKNINETVQEIRTSLKMPVQEYGRAIRAFTSGVDKGSKLLAETTEKSCKMITDSVQTTAENLGAQVKSGSDRVAADYAAMTREVSKNIGEFLSAVSRLAEGLGNIEVPKAPLSQITERLVSLNSSILAIAAAIGPEGTLRVNIGHTADNIRRQSDAVGTALSDVAQRIGRVEVPASVSFNCSKLREAITALEVSVVSLTATASDPRLEKAPQTAADAILKLTSSVSNFRQTVQNADAAIVAAVERDRGDGDHKRRSFLERFFGQ